MALYYVLQDGIHREITTSQSCEGGREGVMFATINMSSVSPLARVVLVSTYAINRQDTQGAHRVAEAT